MGMFDPNRYPQRQSTGLGGRLAIAALIALVGWYMYTSHVEENPVTKEKQYVDLSPSQEIRLGIESAPMMSRKMGGEVPSSDPKAIEVRRMGAFLVEKSPAKNSPWKFQFHLINDRKTVNAFALPGGQIFITLGLLDKLQNEAQLAGVLGHEMGHVIERHTAEQMAKNKLGQWLIMAVGAAATTDQSSGQQATIVASVVNQMFQLRYSRKDESEADTWGLKIMEQAGFNPAAMVEVMKILKAAAGSRGGSLEMFQTHPDPDLRIERINAYLKENPPKPGLTMGKPLSEVYHRQN